MFWMAHIWTKTKSCDIFAKTRLLFPGGYIRAFLKRHVLGVHVWFWWLPISWNRNMRRPILIDAGKRKRFTANYEQATASLVQTKYTFKHDQGIWQSTQCINSWRTWACLGSGQSEYDRIHYLKCLQWVLSIQKWTLYQWKEIAWHKELILSK